MSKWEYLFLSLGFVGGLLGDQQWKVKYTNGKEIPNWKGGLPVHEYCNQLGAQGWEIIGTEFAPVFNQFGKEQYSYFLIVMKRPKASTSK